MLHAQIVQGMLTVPWGMFLYPMKFCLIMSVACFSDCAARFFEAFYRME